MFECCETAASTRTQKQKLKMVKTKTVIFQFLAARPKKCMKRGEVDGSSQFLQPLTLD